MSKTEIDPGGLVSSPPHDFDERPFRINRALPLAPFVGVFGLAFGMSRWRPLNNMPIMWTGLGLSFAAVLLISRVQKKAKSGEDVSYFFPFTTWLAFGPALIALVVIANGTLDRAPIEQHRQVVMQKFISRGRSTSYNIVFSSWRPDHSFERVSVSWEKYAQFQINDPVIVDVHRGALGIPWMGTIRKETSTSVR